MKIPQIPDTLVIDEETGKIKWEACFLDYDPSLFFAGKKVTNEEFNKLFIKQAAQGNFLTSTLKSLLENHFTSVVGQQVKAIYNLKESYFKAFTEADWGTKASDGYYYITISADEHKHPASGEGINIDTELYLIDTDGKYYESPFVYTDVNNTVTLYTDTPLAGYAIIRTNSRATEYNANTIDAANVLDLPDVARTGKFTDLIGVPNFAGLIADNKARIDAIYAGEALIQNVKLAEESNIAVHLTDDNINNTLAKINNCLLSDLFVDPKAAKLVVKEADHAASADKLTVDLTRVEMAGSADYAKEASRLIDLSSTGGSAIQIGKYLYEDIFDTEQTVPVVKEAKRAQRAETAENATNATQAENATNATHAINADTAETANKANTADYTENATNAETADNLKVPTQVIEVDLTERPLNPAFLSIELQKNKTYLISVRHQAAQNNASSDDLGTIYFNTKQTSVLYNTPLRTSQRLAYTTASFNIRISHKNVQTSVTAFALYFMYQNSEGTESNYFSTSMSYAGLNNRLVFTIQELPLKE